MKSKMFAIGIAMLLLIMAASALAADFAGKWIARAGDVDITLTFKVDGNTLSGTVDNPQAGPADIKEGKIDGENISFYVLRKMGENELKISWKGKASGDEIKFVREAAGGQGGGASEIIANRAK
jgi:hypothetical protein